VKKILIALIASVALVLGMGGLVSGASAADYPSSVPVTAPSVPRAPDGGVKTVQGGKTVKITLTLRAGNSSVKSGRIKVIFNGRKYFFKVNSNGVAVIKLKAPKTSKSKRKLFKYEYIPYKGSIYKASPRKTGTILVKR
jgi:hypothetical protein